MPGCGSGVGVCGRAAHSLSIAAATIVARHQGAAVVAHAEHSHSLEEEELRSVAWGGRVDVHGKVAGRMCGWGEGSIARQQAACPNFTGKFEIDLKVLGSHPTCDRGRQGVGGGWGEHAHVGGSIRRDQNRKKSESSSSEKFSAALAQRHFLRDTTRAPHFLIVVLETTYLPPKP